MSEPTPTLSGLHPARASHATLCAALDAAARGATGMNFYSGRGELLEALTYRDLRDQAVRLARQMRASGLQRGDRVALIADTDSDFARAFFACQYAGLVPAPLPLPAALGGRAHYIEHIRRLVQSAGAAAALAPAAFESWLQEACSGLPLKVVGGYQAFDAVDPAGVELAEPTPEQLAYLQFSSGSTRFPLGVAVSHRAVVANVKGIADHGLCMRPDDRCTSWLPMYHDMGLVGFLLTPVYCAISVDFMQTREFARRPLIWLQLISRNGGTLAYSPSFGYELCARRAQSAKPERLDLTRWRAAGIGGDMVRPGPLNQFSETFASAGFRPEAFVPSYGMAEAALALSFAPLNQGLRLDRVDSEALERQHVARPPKPSATRTREFAVCGEVLPGHQMKVLDEFGRALPERRLGRVYARGPSLMRGYYGHPEETARVLSEDGWLDTGDLGYFVGAQIVITGRAKDLIILNGRNVWPQDLEWTAENEVTPLRTGDVAAFSVERDGAESVVVLIECRTQESDLCHALCEEVAGVLRLRHGVEATVVPVPPRSLPQTSSGKLSRSRARALYLQNSFSDLRARLSA